MDHAEMLGREKQRWQELGYRVSAENQNWFSLPGRFATLGGKPDLVALKGDHNVIVDVKTGRERESDVTQVMIYMYALPHIGIYYGKQFHGKVVYHDSSIDIPSGEIDEKFIERLGTRIQTLASTSPPLRAPSYLECLFCSITREDCSERIDELHETVQSKDF